MDVFYSGHISGNFDGFDEGKIYKLDNGTYWIQSEYEYDYTYEYEPEATILDSFGTYYLLVCGKKVEVEQLCDVIESRIDGNFEGWDKDKVYKLQNGDIWQQSSYHYEYKYAYNPEVIIYCHNGTTYMSVDGARAEVKKLISSESVYRTDSYNANSYSSSSTPNLSLRESLAYVASQLDGDQPETKESPKKESKKSGGCAGIIAGALLFTFIICGVQTLFSSCFGSSKKETDSHQNEVQLSYSAEYYKGKNYYDKTIELMESGLTNIQLSPIYDQKGTFLSSVGQIETIKINDYYDFKSGIWVKKDSPVSISYHAIDKTVKQEFNNEKNNHIVLNRVDISLPSYLIEEGRDASSAIYHVKGDDETKFSILINDKRNWDVLSQYDSHFIQKSESVSTEADSSNSIIALAKKNYKVYSVQIVSVWLENKNLYIHFALVSLDSCKNDYSSDFNSIISGLFFPQESDIQVDFSPNDFKGKNYEEVLATLQGKGFKNVNAENLKDILIGLFSKEGTVDSISINGDSNFKPGSWINENAEIVIKYHGKK